MLETLNRGLNALSAFQFLLLAAVLWSLRSGNRLSHRLLAGFLLAKGVCIADLVFGAHFDFFRQRFPHVFYVFFPFQLAYMPLLYLYTRSAAYRDFRLRPVHALLALPFAAALAAVLPAFVFRSAETKRALLAGPVFGAAFWRVYGVVYWVQVFAHLAASWAVLRRYSREIRQWYSTLDRINLSWLRTVLGGFTAVYALACLDEAAFRLSPEAGGWLSFGLTLSFLGFATLLIFKGLRVSESSAGIEQAAKPKPFALDPDTATATVNRLNEVMNREKPYLAPSLSLNGLAERIAVPPRHLSWVLNAELNQNFFDYVNRYRVEEAKRMLSGAAEAGRRTVLEVLYEVGFNSKSVFNSAFKKYTGVTPKQFRRLHSN